jgi:hypothetical protein
MGGANEDKRRAGRRRVLKGALIAYDDRRRTLPCTVRDISDTGARLRLTGAITAPDTFELLIDLDGFEADCQVVRRRADEIAVRFIATRSVPAKRAQIVNPLIPAAAPSLRKKPNTSTT